MTILGWFTTYFLWIRKEKRKLRVQYLSQQIEKLYGPLLGFILQTEIAYDSAKRILPKSKDGLMVETEHFSDEDLKIWRYFVEEYFIPINKIIADLINENIHLIMSDNNLRTPLSALPESFNSFLYHKGQFESFHLLWKKRGLSRFPERNEYTFWPKEFKKDIEHTLNELIAQYQNYFIA